MKKKTLYRIGGWAARVSDETITEKKAQQQPTISTR
jgi:hypothetical protein